MKENVNGSGVRLCCGESVDGKEEEKEGGTGEEHVEFKRKATACLFACILCCVVLLVGGKVKL